MFKSPEVREAVITGGIVTVFIAIIGYLVTPAAGAIGLCTGIALCLVFVGVIRKRQRKVRELSEKIDKILHQEVVMVLDDSREGDLAVLESEIHKMTIRLREQTFRLQQDKVFLNDAVADISHQIRTPMTAVNLLVTRLYNKDLEPMERRRLLHGVEENMNRIEWLITSLLKMAKIDSGTAGFQSSPVDVDQLICQAVDPLLISMELRDQLMEFQSKGCESFIGDMNWSKEAISNILKNCMEHTPMGGSIEVTASENALYTQIEIKDNGPGFKEADLPHLFERFYKGMNGGGNGYGIGLALSRQIITRQNGTIKAENRKNGGARFVIRFYKGPKNYRERVGQ